MSKTWCVRALQFEYSFHNDFRLVEQNPINLVFGSKNKNRTEHASNPAKFEYQTACALHLNYTDMYMVYLSNV